MKLILSSQGFTTPEIAHGAAELAGRPLNELNVAVINEAYTGISAARDMHWLVEELSWITDFTKGKVSFVNLRAYVFAEVRQRLEFADVIYLVGGAQIVLPKLFRETGFNKLLAELAEHKVIMGTSAGANVLGKQIMNRSYWHDQYGEADEYLAAPCLGLVDFNILPHFERDDHPQRTRERLTPLLKNHPFPLYGLTDTQAVAFNDGKLEFWGGEPVVFGLDTAE